MTRFSVPAIAALMLGGASVAWPANREKHDDGAEGRDDARSGAAASSSATPSKAPGKAS